MNLTAVCLLVSCGSDAGSDAGDSVDAPIESASDASSPTPQPVPTLEASQPASALSLDVAALFEALTSAADTDTLGSCPAASPSFLEALEQVLTGSADFDAAQVSSAANSSVGAALLKCSWREQDGPARRAEIVAAAGVQVSRQWVEELSLADVDDDWVDSTWKPLLGGQYLTTLRSSTDECALIWVGSNVMLGLTAKVENRGAASCPEVEQLFFTHAQELAASAATW